MKKIGIVFGTRPEIIKLFPIVLELEERKDFKFELIASQQQDKLLKDAIDSFHLKNVRYLGAPKLKNLVSSLTEISSNLDQFARNNDFDFIMVQGDTATACAGALVSFLNKIPLIHVEAGLRSGNKNRPFPEEIFRQLISRIATFNFAPSKIAKQNLLKEGIESKDIYVVGNTIVDVLRICLNSSKAIVRQYHKPTVLVTMHRRENFDKSIDEVCRGIHDYLEQDPEIQVVFVKHSNPKATRNIDSILGNLKQVKITEALDYRTFVELLACSDCVITDSGGVQEEAFLLDKKLIIARTETERPEVLSGKTKILKLDRKAVKETLTTTISEIRNEIKRSETVVNLNTELGNGTAARKIIEVVDQWQA